MRRIHRRRRPSDWPWGLLASIWLHGAVLASLLLVKRPDPPPVFVPIVVTRWLTTPDSNPDPPPEGASDAGTTPIRRSNPSQVHVESQEPTIAIPAGMADVPVGSNATITPMVGGVDEGKTAIQDPVDSLRDALGWGPIDRTKFGPRGAWAAAMGLDGLAETPAEVSTNLPSTWTEQADLKDPAMGNYVDQLNAIILRRWATMDLTVDERAGGISGTVLIRYQIWPTGKVTDRQIAASSGQLGLDRMALEAIPEHVPRFTNDMNLEQPFWHQVRLQYKNPLVATRNSQ